MSRAPASVQSLKALSRKNPDSYQIVGAMLGASSEQDYKDRSLVLMSGSLLDWCLEATVSSKLAPIDAAEDRALFHNAGPLSTMSARIQMAYCLGLINAEFRDELDHIREI